MTATFTPGPPCPCCGDPLVGADTVANVCGVTTSRVYQWAVRDTAPKLAEKTRGFAGERLWCPNEVRRWAEAGGKPVQHVKARSNPWSKRATAQPLGADGQPVEWDQSVKIKVRWRHNGSGRKQTFTGDGHRAEAQRLIDNVALAHRDRWTGHDEFFRPVPPPTATAPTLSPAPIAVHAIGVTADRSSETPDGVAATATSADEPTPAYDPTRTVAAAVTIRQGQIASLDISVADRRNRLSALEFIKAHLVYPEGHPQLERLGIAAGSSFLLDDAEGLTTQDLNWFVTVRQTTNLRALGKHERDLAKWQQNCDRLRSEADSSGAEVVLPERPVLPPMSVSKRTERFTWQAVERVLELAMEYRWIAHNPYTRSVKDQVGRTAKSAEVDPRHVFSQDEVGELWRRMARHTVTTRNPFTGKMETVSGERYSLFVELRGRCFLRIEEAVALFDEDFMDLDTDFPFLRIQGAEPAQPSDPLGDDAATRRGPIKQRRPGEWRDVPIPLDMVPRINAHLDRYCAPNGRVFLSPFGRWLNVQNWKENFWDPVLDDVFRPLEIPDDVDRRTRRTLVEANGRRATLRRTPFRNLRHAGITACLNEYSVAEVAQMAGNSIEVISANYAGVIRDLERRRSTSRQALIASPATTDDVSSLSDAELDAIVDQLAKEKLRRTVAA